MIPVQIIVGAVSILAGKLPPAVQRWREKLRERRADRFELDVLLLQRMQDTTEGLYADVYDLAVTHNYTASEINDALERLKHRGLVEQHPGDGRWVVSERGRQRVRAGT